MAVDDQRRAPGRRTRRPRTTTLALTVLAAAAGVLLCCYPWLVGLDRTTPFVQIVAWRVALVTVVGPLVVLLLLATWVWRPLRRRVLPAGIVLLTVVVVATALIAPRAIPGASPPPGGRTFRVLSLNVDNGEADTGALAAVIRHARPDVVVMPEAGDRYAAALVAALPGDGYHATSAGPPGLDNGESVSVLLGPGLQGATSEHQGTRFWWLHVSGGTMPVDLTAVHVAAPVPEQAWKWETDMTALIGPCRSGRPVIVVGDFNSTTDNHRFQRTAAGCQDAASAVGKGLPATWPDWLPPWLGMQIDHALLGGPIGVDDVSFLTLPRTDHRGILVTARLPG